MEVTTEAPSRRVGSRINESATLLRRRTFEGRGVNDSGDLAVVTRGALI